MSEVSLKLNIARSYHAMVLVGAGEVLITGGISQEEGVLGDAEILDLSVARLRQLENRHISRAGHRCVRTADGKILLIGGADAKQQPEGRIEVFDPASNSFSVLTKLESPRVHHQAVALKNGHVLVIGGLDSAGNALDTLELIDPAGRRTEKIAATLSRRRYHHQAVVLENGSVLITGGAGDAGTSRSAEIFDVASRAFLPPIEMHEERVIHTATLLPDGRVFTFSNGVGEIFLPSDRRFSRIPGKAGPEIRDGHTATLLGNGTVFILGGGMPQFSEDLLGAPVIFDPRENSFLELDTHDQSLNRAEHAALLLPEGGVLITGGRTVHSVASDGVVVYKPGQSGQR